MKTKELLARIFTEQASKEEIKQLEDLLENDDDFASVICEYDIPVLIELMCKNEFISKKEYMDKYKFVKDLYLKKRTISDYLHLTPQLIIEKVAPYLTIELISKFIDVVDAQCKLIARIDMHCKQTKARIEAFEKKSSTDGSENKDAADRKIASKKKECDAWEEDRKLLNEWLNQPEFLKEKLSEIKRITREQTAVKMDKIMADPRILVDSTESADSMPVELLARIHDLEVANDELKHALRDFASDNNSLKQQIKELQLRIDNLQKIKEELEAKYNKTQSQYDKSEKSLADAQVQLQEYDKILSRLTGRIVDALAPILELERITTIFRQPETTVTPQGIVDYLMEPLCQIRENFESIELTTAQKKMLSKEYSIAIGACGSKDDWINGTTIAYDVEKHTAKGKMPKVVYLQNRGFLYKNHLDEVKITKAEVVESAASYATEEVVE